MRSRLRHPRWDGADSGEASVENERFVYVSFPARSGAMDLSAAETTLVAAIASGLTRQEIAEARGVSVRTVDNQTAKIFRKCGVHSREELLSRILSVSEEGRNS